MWSVPETSSTSCIPAPVSFLSGWYTIGQGPTGRRCVFVTRVSSPMRVPFPPARITPRMDIQFPPTEGGRVQPAARLNLPVLLSVVTQVVLVLDRRDPVTVGLVPFDRFGQPPIE